MGAILKVLPKLITVLPSILQFLPLVVNLVKMVENLIGAGHGPVKKALVVDLVKVAIKIAEKATDQDLVKDENALAEGIGELVEAVVAALKAAKQV